MHPIEAVPSESRRLFRVNQGTPPGLAIVV
jgi:hypothetical protein